MIKENSPTIITDRLILRKFTMADAEALLEILSDVEVNTFLPWHPLKSLKEAQIFLQDRFLSYYAKPTSYRYAICLKEDNKPIGYIWLADDESNDLGYGLKKEFWQQDVATEAGKALVKWIAKAGYTYITATHDINNIRSGNVLKKLGMRYKYSYLEQWQPKNILATFRMYQLNFDKNHERTYMKYWNDCEKPFIEVGV